MQEIIADRYVLTRDPVREGGMSTVQKAFDREEGRFCAIKRMRNLAGDDLRRKESFHREYKALNELWQHPNIVTLYEAGHDDDGLYMVLEWIPHNLFDLIQAEGAFTWRDYYRKIGRPVLEALAFAQSRGWVHRDIKPQNILIADSGVARSRRRGAM
jgi:serine/threonine protein kinase